MTLRMMRGAYLIAVAAARRPRSVLTRVLSAERALEEQEVNRKAPPRFIGSGLARHSRVRLGVFKMG